VLAGFYHGNSATLPCPTTAVISNTAPAGTDCCPPCTRLRRCCSRQAAEAGLGGHLFNDSQGQGSTPPSAAAIHSTAQNQQRAAATLLARMPPPHHPRHHLPTAQPRGSTGRPPGGGGPGGSGAMLAILPPPSRQGVPGAARAAAVHQRWPGWRACPRPRRAAVRAGEPLSGVGACQAASPQRVRSAVHAAANGAGRGQHTRQG
jgi:hypothetical protein